MKEKIVVWDLVDFTCAYTLFISLHTDVHVKVVFISLILSYKK